MNKKSILSLMVAGLSLSGLGTLNSCEDVIRPDMERYVSDFNGKDTVYFYLGIMRNLQDLAESNTLTGELRSDLVTSTDYTSDSIANIMNYNNPADGTNGLLNRAAYYKVINQCNFYLAQVDTMSSKNGYYYMRRETAQVLAARAWTYMQLVQAYGEAPFITEPVRSAGTGWETSAPKITTDNMVDLLKTDLERSMAYQEVYGKVNYGNYNTGAGNVNSVLLNIPASVVLADMYLMRGASTNDYEAAAQLYYDYLRKETGRVNGNSSARWLISKSNGVESYLPFYGSWVSGVSSFSSSDYTSTNGEVRTFLPSASNSAFGRVMTQASEIFGFKVLSQNATLGSSSSSSSSSESSAESTVSSVGAISLTPTDRMRQVAPSNSYIKLNKTQSYSGYEASLAATIDVNYDIKYRPTGDARLEGTAPELVTTDGKKMRFIQKFNASGSRGAFTFRYGIPFYRIRKIYLNFAEAINRAGFPRHAFAILRDGLGGMNTFQDKAGTVNKIPELMLSSSTFSDADSTIYGKYYVSHVANGLDYLTADEILRARDKKYLDFSRNTSFSNVGIHELGTGEKGDLDTVYTYAKVVSQRILDEANRSNTLTNDVKALATKIKNEVYVDTITVKDSIDRSNYKYVDAPAPVAASAEEINAVETLIIDEMALETAYEGYRMGDLIRIARHKNVAGTDGTNWLAWKIARRNVDLAPYENPTSYDATLFGKLQNVSNWYLRSPQY